MTQEHAQKIIERYGYEYLLRQLTEECLELEHAALKIIRAQNGETPVSMEDASAAFFEELADVGVMTNFVIEYLLAIEDRAQWHRLMCEKSRRMVERLIGEAGT